MLHVVEKQQRRYTAHLVGQPFERHPGAGEREAESLRDQHHQFGMAAARRGRRQAFEPTARCSSGRSTWRASALWQQARSKSRRGAWQVLPACEGELNGRVEKSAYLGSSFECTFATEVGAIFVVAPDLARPWQPGDVVSLRLAGHGLSVVAA